MNGEAVKELERIAREAEAIGTTVTIDGVEYSARPLHDVRKENPAPSLLAVHTLTGLVDYLRANRDQLPLADLQVHVVSQESVQVIGRLHGHFQQRFVYAEAAFEPLLGRSFQFGQYYDAETFVIALQALFYGGGDREKVLSVVGNIREEQVRNTSDDGKTQTVVASAGVVKRVDVDVPNPVTLAPYRTFRELAQPASQFVLRLRPGQAGGLPTCALFEADGGQWKLEAIDRIRQFLRGVKELDAIAVIA
jgi:hypothetical protein